MEIPLAPIVAWRNGASCLGSKGEKDGRRPKVFWLRHSLPRRPSFSPSRARQCAPFRRERSARAESPTIHLKTKHNEKVNINHYHLAVIQHNICTRTHHRQRVHRHRGIQFGCLHLRGHPLRGGCDYPSGTSPQNEGDRKRKCDPTCPVSGGKWEVVSLCR